MQPKAIETREEYRRALDKFSIVFQAMSRSLEADEADELAVLIKKYEDEHFVVGFPFNRTPGQ